MSRERITITKFLTRESFLKTAGPDKTEKFENTALFLRLGLSFTKTGKRWLFVFVYGKRFENGTSRERWPLISLTEFSSNTNPA